MQKGQEDYWRNRYEKLRAENRRLREKQVTLKRENRGLHREIRNRHKLFHSIPAGILLVQQGNIIDINSGALEHLGYGPDEVKGRSFLDFVHRDVKKFMKDLHNKRISGKRVPSQYETDLVTKYGERVPCEARVNRITFNGKRAFVVNLTLLEKRKKRESDLIQSNKREALMTMVSGLTRTLSRDLEGIRENLRLLNGIADSENEALMKGLENMQSASDGLTESAQKLESLLRTKHDPKDDVLFDLRKVVKKAVSLTSPMLKDLAESGKQKINLKTYLRSVSPIAGDPNEIRDLIAHLVMNAVEAMPQGGDLYLTTEENTGYVHIYIQDSGLGIPDSVKDLIWDPFFSTKGKDSLGLGLSLSYAIVKRHKGEMEVTSQRDHGTTFTIRLPLASKERKPKARSPKRKIKNAHILLIRGEEIVSELLSQVLASKGHKVVMVSSGREAAQTMKKKKCDLVLADSAAPDAETAVLTQKIRKMSRDLPIALMTEQAAGEKSWGTRKSAFDLIITKPLDVDKVVGQIENLLRNKGGG